MTIRFCKRDYLHSAVPIHRPSQMYYCIPNKHIRTFQSDNTPLHHGHFAHHTLCEISDGGPHITKMKLNPGRVAATERKSQISNKNCCFFRNMYKQRHLHFGTWIRAISVHVAGKAMKGPVSDPCAFARSVH